MIQPNLMFIFYQQILQQNIVVVNELNLIKETLNNNAVSGRPFIFRCVNSRHELCHVWQVDATVTFLGEHVFSKPQAINNLFIVVVFVAVTL